MVAVCNITPAECRGSSGSSGSSSSNTSCFVSSGRNFDAKPCVVRPLFSRVNSWSFCILGHPWAPEVWSSQDVPRCPETFSAEAKRRSHKWRSVSKMRKASSSMTWPSGHRRRPKLRQTAPWQSRQIRCVENIYIYIYPYYTYIRVY